MRAPIRLVVPILALVFVSCGASSTPGAVVPAAGASGSPSDALGEQRSDAASVAVVASWISDTALRVTMDTHSVDLDAFDLASLARLRLDQGPWVSAGSWDAPKGGHHRDGTLTFSTLDAAAVARAKLIEVEIRDVGVPLRTLRWERP